MFAIVSLLLRIIVSLVAAKGKNTFYEKFGFITRSTEEFGP